MWRYEKTIWYVKRSLRYEEDRMLLVALFSYSDQAFHTQTFVAKI